jgi:predicted metal-dependent peptidase
MNAVMVNDMTMKLKKAHINLMRHPETCLYSGVILMGESNVIDDCPTAYTDGFNKRYGRGFIEKLDMKELCGLVMHENLHVMLKHIPRHRDLMKKDAKLANVAMDFVVNDVIVELNKKAPDLIKLPPGALYKAKYHDWSVRQVWDDLYQQREKEKGRKPGDQPSDNGQPSDSVSDMESLDEHDVSAADSMSDEEAEKFSERISDAISEGAIIAGRFGTKLPRTVQELIEPKVYWRDELRDFVTEAMSGRSDYTWRNLNRRRLIDDLYLPSVESERIGEGIKAVDTSASISNEMLAMVGGEVASICDTCMPDLMRMLWWDTRVHGEQVFEGNYEGIASMLKPMGGGGTRLSCVSEYINENNLHPMFIIVFTDGYVESNVKWDVTCPVLWLLPPLHNRDFNPPSGRKIVIE